MSIFGSIMSTIFGGAAKADPAPTPTPSATPGAPSPTTGGGHPQAAATKAAPVTQVDVAAIMDGLAAKSKEKGLEWRKSIVDLMKLLELDSSLSARRELAKELKYTGDTKDTATMNVWLHKQVMTKLAENGGKVPADLKD